MTKECKLKIVLDPGAIMPERAHPDDAGLDLFSTESFTVWPCSTHIVDTGVHIEIPKGYVGRITSKSSLTKKGLLTTGTIDAGYTGSIKVVVLNTCINSHVQIKKGQKIAQLVIHPIITPEIEVVGSLKETERGDGGFGSTGAMAKGGDPDGQV